MRELRRTTVPEVSLRGVSLIAGKPAESKGKEFHGIDPTTGEKLPTAFFAASADDVTQACTLAEEATEAFAATTGKERGALLRAIAEELTAMSEAIVARA